MAGSQESWWHPDGHAASLRERSGEARGLLANVGRVGLNAEATPEWRKAAQNADGPDDPAWRWLRLCDTVPPASELAGPTDGAQGRIWTLEMQFPYSNSYLDRPPNLTLQLNRASCPC